VRLTYVAGKRTVCESTAQSDIGGFVLPLRRYVRRVASLTKPCVVGVRNSVLQQWTAAVDDEDDDTRQ
jgi:hypothetical protein